MSEHTYVAIFDPLDEGFDPLAVRETVQSDDRVIHWWNHIVNCFLVTFKGNSDELARLFSSAANGGRFFVMQVDPRDSEGILADRSWSWIKKREMELASKTAKQSA